MGKLDIIRTHYVYAFARGRNLSDHMHKQVSPPSERF